ncbi:hypothetical protein RFI_25593, partial [Reticulomyxa filosa]
EGIQKNYIQILSFHIKKNCIIAVSKFIIFYILTVHAILLLRAFLIIKKLLEKVSNFSDKCIQINIKRKTFEQTKNACYNILSLSLQSKCHNFDKHINKTATVLKLKQQIQ